MHDKVKLLDYGYLELVERWGSDDRIIEAARMSTGKGFLGWGTPENPGDEKLLGYLWKNKHHTPFEMAGMTVEVQAPIMVFREWMRHRVPFGYNEMSARYIPLLDVNYIPSVERLMVDAGTKNRQAGTVVGADTLTKEKARAYQLRLETQYLLDQEMYEWALQIGVPKELARIHLPVGRYSRMRATANLRGWLAFLVLRMAPTAQYEIRVYANAVGELIAEHFPRTWELFRGIE